MNTGAPGHCWCRGALRRLHSEPNLAPGKGFFMCWGRRQLLGVSPGSLSAAREPRAGIGLTLLLLPAGGAVRSARWGRPGEPMARSPRSVLRPPWGRRTDPANTFTRLSTRCSFLTRDYFRSQWQQILSECNLSVRPQHLTGSVSAGRLECRAEERLYTHIYTSSFQALSRCCCLLEFLVLQAVPAVCSALSLWSFEGSLVLAPLQIHIS